MSTTECISLMLAIISTFISIYQYVLIKEREKENKKIQFFMLAIGDLATGKYNSWRNQFDNLHEDNDNNRCVSIMMKARDEFAEFINLTSALEKAIDTDSSASMDKIKQNIEYKKYNKELQTN